MRSFVVGILVGVMFLSAACAQREATPAPQVTVTTVPATVPANTSATIPITVQATASTDTPIPTGPPDLVLSVLDRECTSSHTAKLPSSPAILCNLEIPNVAIYSDGLAVYHVWERKSYGSRIGGGLYTGRLSFDRLEGLLTSLDEAGVFRLEGTSAGGDAPYYVVSAKFGGEESSIVLAPWRETPEEAQLVKLLEELLIFRDWAGRGAGFREIGKFGPTNIRLITSNFFAPAASDWPLSSIPLEDELVLSGERSKEVQELIPLGWFGDYRYQGNDYVVGYVPEYPHGWP